MAKNLPGLASDGVMVSMSFMAKAARLEEMGQGHHEPDTHRSQSFSPPQLLQ
jgi:hypothetical protein